MVGRFIGVIACVPVTMLLTISFFVLVVIRKVESNSLKAFGYVVTSFLWVSAAIIAITGLLVIATGRMHCPLMAKLAHQPMTCMHAPDAAKMQMPR
jgi:hypothetical protein